MKFFELLGRIFGIKRKARRQWILNCTNQCCTACMYWRCSMYRLSIILPIIILSGCNMFRSDSRPPVRDFPAWCAPQCHEALAEAVAIVERVGVHKIKPHSVKVVFVQGERKFDTGWGWWVANPHWRNGGAWVGGLTSGTGYLIQMVIDPGRATDPSAVHWPSLVHEFVHHLLIRNGYGSEHLSVYDDVVPGWREARQIIGKRKVAL